MKELDRVRAICLALPEATEKIAWGEPTWRVGKIFAMFNTHHHGDPHLSVVLNAEEGVQESLVRAKPKHFYRPPYVGGAGWIGVPLDTGLDWGVVESLIRAAWRVTAPRRLVKRLDDLGESGGALLGITGNPEPEIFGEGIRRIIAARS